MRHLTTGLLLTIMTAQGVMAADAPVSQHPAVAPSVPAAFRPQNIELGPRQRLNATLLDATGQPLAGKSVKLTCRNTTVVVTTGHDGSIAASDLHGGTWTLAVDDRRYVCRLWVHGTAPPKSLQTVAFVWSDGEAVRGQNFVQRWRTSNTERAYGAFLVGLGGTAAYFALSRDNISD